MILTFIEIAMGSLKAISSMDVPECCTFIIIVNRNDIGLYRGGIYEV